MVGQRPPDEPEREACSRDGALLPGARPVYAVYSRVEPLRWDAVCSPGAALLSEARPVYAVHSQVEAWPRGRSLDEAYSPDEAHSPSPKRSADEVRCCAVLGCYSPQCWVEECCSLDEEPPSCLLAELRHS